MKTKQEIVKQYVASLKEDRELDYIFPLLLERMGFRVLSAPKQSKGQSQYGRDVIAVKREKGINTLFLFELKGFRAKDINDKSLNEKDGLIESMRASNYTLYRDASIPDLDNMRRSMFTSTMAISRRIRSPHWTVLSLWNFRRRILKDGDLTSLLNCFPNTCLRRQS